MRMDVIEVFKLIVVIAFVLIVVSCASQPKYKMDEFGNIIAFELMYDERERGPNQENFVTRIIILDDVMRIADSRNWDDYILVNRKTKTVYSVNSEDKTIFVVKGQPVSIDPPMPITYDAVSQPSSAIPKVNNLKATHFKYLANGEHCYDSISLGSDYYPDVAKALGEFKQIMAGEQAKTLATVPQDQLDACDLAINIFHATDHLQKGFPLREWDRNGYTRFIRFYRQTGRVKPEELELPTDYTEYSVGKS